MSGPFRVVSSVSFSVVLTTAELFLGVKRRTKDGMRCCLSSVVLTTAELFLGVKRRTKDGMGCCSSYDLHVPMYWSVFFNAGLFIATGLVLCAMADIFFLMGTDVYIHNPLNFARKKRVIGRRFPKRMTRKDPKKLKNMYDLLFFGEPLCQSSPI